jgi:hypothetical protein
VDTIFSSTSSPKFTAEAALLRADLARLAARVLKPSGMLVSYSGVIFLPDVVRRLGDTLESGSDMVASRRGRPSSEGG